MAISPYTILEIEDIETNTEKEVHPSMTYEFNFDIGEFTENIIDEIDALRQFIRKAISTTRLKYLIYDQQYGCELTDLIALDLKPNLLASEIERVIKEALIYDERIKDVTEFIIDYINDQFHVTFKVITNTGTIIAEEVIS
ncbi:DUF2634 domain-containing protein [Chengkuizengella axinellae]|uniref:DUF2634 domain-containing protein n=1 Tax=Chengkuizengella axinellae TaxID=3064388 RepID=A0ABT9IXM2_9BACL|nr:DUF2634 domain-containing protein [Chengkuizengella sp. 2205SS18-9]MDP5273554.1 DUF2634 domain-containing protein [Chengkuizengella sp. 2205SS18-9]